MRTADYFWSNAIQVISSSPWALENTIDLQYSYFDCTIARPCEQPSVRLIERYTGDFCVTVSWRTQSIYSILTLIVPLRAPVNSRLYVWSKAMQVISSSPWALENTMDLLPLSSSHTATLEESHPVTICYGNMETRHVFVKHGCPRRQQSQNMAKISMSYILTRPHPQGHVMSVGHEQPLDELTVQVWLLYHNLNFKYCTLYVSGMELQITTCPLRTFQAGGYKKIDNNSGLS